MVGERKETDVPVDLGDLTHQWEVTDLLFRRYDELPSNAFGPELFDRFIDEQQVAGHRVYIGAAAHLDNAREHLDLLRMLLTQVGPTPRVPWTLMRSVFESSFWANWLLEPPTSFERRWRALRLEVSGHKERKNFYADYYRAHPDESARTVEHNLGHEKVFRAEIDSMSKTWTEANQSINVHQEIAKLAVVKEMGATQSQAVASWRVLSGMQHGHVYALLHLSDVVDGTQILGGRTGTVTIGDAPLHIVGSVTHILLVTALSKFIKRSTEATGSAD
jgi:hypothetical protein